MRAFRELYTVQERDGTNAVTWEYTWGINMGGGIGGLLNLKYNGQDYNYLYDGKGNVMVVIDENQQPVASYRYDVFGRPLKKTGSLDQPYRFSTKQYDEQTGLNDFGVRFYNAAIGRWMTRDPLGEAGGINLYNFVGNNPVNFGDPYGLLPYLKAKGWTGVVLSGAGSSLILYQIGAGASAIPGGQPIGFALIVTGGLLTLWDIMDSPETIEQFDEKLDPVKDAVNELQNELNSFESNKCPDR